MMGREVLVIQNRYIYGLNISPLECVKWVDESFRLKALAQLPPKMSVHPQGNDFFTSMPCCLPSSYGVFGMKVVHRILGATPSLGSEILLYDSKSGQLQALIDGDWITTMRTGAVAALSIQHLQRTNTDTYSFMGLGNTARATALCLLSIFSDKKLKFRLLRYKTQAESFIERFKEVNNVSFEIVDTIDHLVSGADVLISCITDAQNLICENNELYRKGLLLVPIHTRGFQNCDLFFDKVYGDDTGHVSGFRYFDRFKEFDEFGNILIGKNRGRENDEQRIVVYNIGLGLHDVVFAYKIHCLLKNTVSTSFILDKEDEKFWI